MQPRGVCDVESAAKAIVDHRAWVELSASGDQVIEAFWKIQSAFERFGLALKYAPGRAWPRKPKFLRGVPGFYAIGRRWRMQQDRHCFKLIKGGLCK